MDSEPKEGSLAHSPPQVTKFMSDARPIQPTKPLPGLSTGQVQPAEASRAVATVLRYGWQKAREHLRHSLFWICLSAYLAYALWQKEPSQQAPTEPAKDAQTAASPDGSPTTRTVMRPTFEPPLVGNWDLVRDHENDPHTRLEFLPDGTVVSRTQRMATKGDYKTSGNETGYGWPAPIRLAFPGKPLFWDVCPLPDYYLVSDDKLTLIATRGKNDIAPGQFYRFKRIAPANGHALPASGTSTQ